MSRVRVWSLLSELARVILRGDAIQEDETPSTASGAAVPLQADPPIVRWQPRARARDSQSMSSVWRDVQARALQAGLVPCASPAPRVPALLESDLPIPATRPAVEMAPAPVRTAPVTAAARTSAAIDAAIDWGPVMLARVSDDFASSPATAD